MRDALQKPIVIGQLSAYSNPGFSRNGAVKPEIVAPGEYYYTSFAKLLDHTGVHIYNPKTNPGGNAPDTSGNYMLFNGTSAATPYVAGVVALMFQKKARLTLGEIRELLKTAASQDSFTATLPNPAWGYGKLDLNAVRKALGRI
jgi:subtilisin family serine protease